MATRVGSATRFGVNERNPSGLASHDGKLYMVGNIQDALYTLDTTTGVATRVGSATRFGVSEFNPSGLASHDGKLYMVGANQDALFTLDTTTGVATRVGSATHFGVSLFNPSRLASHEVGFPQAEIPSAPRFIIWDSSRQMVSWRAPATNASSVLYYTIAGISGGGDRIGPNKVYGLSADRSSIFRNDASNITVCAISAVGSSCATG